MINIDEVPLKRKIIGCVILALPVFYYVINNRKIPNAGILDYALYFCYYGVGFLFFIGTIAGLLSIPLCLIYFMVIYLGKLVFGAKVEDVLSGIVGVAYLAIGISLIYSYYIMFGGRIPTITW